MLSFITTPSNLLPIHTKRNTSSTCSLTKKPLPNASPRSIPNMQSQLHTNEHDDDDDDDAMGTPPRPSVPGSGLGMTAPPLSPSDRIYLDGAKNDKEYMARIAEIARRLQRQKDLDNMDSPKQTPDQYIEGLSRTAQPPAEGHFGGPRIDAVDEYMDTLARMYRKDRGIDDTPLPEDRRKASAPAGPAATAAPGVDPTLVARPDDSVAQLEHKMRAIKAEIQDVSRTLNNPPEESVSEEVHAKLDEMARALDTDTAPEDHEDVAEMSLEEGARKIAQLQAQIRAAAGLEEQPHLEQQPETNPDPPAVDELPNSQVAQAPSTVDKQIGFLENYLSKLQKEASEDPEAHVQETTSQEAKPNYSEEAQIAMSNVAEQISKMPGERTVFEGLQDTPGEMSPEEKMAAFQQIRRRAESAQTSSEFVDPLNVTLPQRKTADEDGDEPSPESEAEYDSFESSFGNKDLLIEEIETEVKTYTRDVKALLQRHETRLQVLLARLRAS